PELTERFEAPRQRRTLFHGALRGTLDGRPIGERIAERNAQLDDVRARRRDPPHEFHRLPERGMTGGQIRNERAPTGVAPRTETRGETVRLKRSSPRC